MILHELFKNIGEEYDFELIKLKFKYFFSYTEVNTIPKRYRCTLHVNGKSFQMESANKKAAKQKCAELAVRDLRPDLHITPFEEGITAKAVAVSSGGDSNGNGLSAKRSVSTAKW